MCIRDRYLAAARLEPTVPPLPTDRIFFTNFFVSRIAWWDQPKVTSFLSDVNASGGIYRHRWGDAPIQSAALRLHANKSALIQLDMEYLHMSTRNRIARGTEVPFTAEGIANEHFRQLATAALTNSTNGTNATDGGGGSGGDGDGSSPGGGGGCPDVPAAFDSIFL
eukprot:1957280-Prymnesium_polylepis.1